MPNEANAVTREANEASLEAYGWLERARKRVDRERRLSDPVHAAHYAAASFGQSPYVALPDVGIVVVSRSGWGC